MHFQVLPFFVGFVAGACILIVLYWWADRSVKRREAERERIRKEVANKERS